MPVLVPLFIGASAAAVAITVANAPVIVAAAVGVGAAVISKKDRYIGQDLRRDRKAGW